MRFFRNKKRSAPPHTWYPEILHWQEGDKIKARNVTKTGIIEKIEASHFDTLNIIYLFRSISQSGIIVIEEKETGIKHRVDFKKFLKKATNICLENRRIASELNTSKEYMTLISEFQKAYEELSMNDDETKLLEE